jgi:hypothetical protein
MISSYRMLIFDSFFVRTIREGIKDTFRLPESPRRTPRFRKKNRF